MTERKNNLRIMIKNNDKQGLEDDFENMFAVIGKQMTLSEIFEVGKFVRELQDYIMEEVE